LTGPAGRARARLHLLLVEHGAGAAADEVDGAVRAAEAGEQRPQVGAAAVELVDDAVICANRLDGVHGPRRRDHRVKAGVVALARAGVDDAAVETLLREQKAGDDRVELHLERREVAGRAGLGVGRHSRKRGGKWQT